MSRPMCAALALALVIAPRLARADVPGTVRFQGRLMVAGAPASGPVAATFTLFDAAQGGNVLWTEVQTVTQ